MAKETKQKISETAVGVAAPVVVYAGSAEEALIAPHRRITIASNIVGSNYLPSNSLYTDSIGLEEVEITDALGEGDDDTTEITINPQDVPQNKAPTLMDIELVSNVVSYDASGNPYSVVTFKVRNSSGEKVKSINARVKVL
jgi:hypothetical protein